MTSRQACEHCRRPAMFVLTAENPEPGRTAPVLFACGIHRDRCRQELRDLGHAETREETLIRGELQTRAER